MDIEKQLQVIQSYPAMFDEEENENMGRSISIEELESALKSVARSKSPDPEGWSVEIFLYFVDIIGSDLLLLAEELRINFFIYAALNSTFITLIGKRSRT